MQMLEQPTSDLEQWFILKCGDEESSLQGLKGDADFSLFEFLFMELFIKHVEVFLPALFDLHQLSISFSRRKARAGLDNILLFLIHHTFDSIRVELPETIPV